MRMSDFYTVSDPLEHQPNQNADGLYTQISLYSRLTGKSLPPIVFDKPLTLDEFQKRVSQWRHEKAANCMAAYNKIPKTNNFLRSFFSK